jgi:hypothetical protein
MKMIGGLYSLAFLAAATASATATAATEILPSGMSGSNSSSSSSRSTRIGGTSSDKSGIVVLPQTSVDGDDDRDVNDDIYFPNRTTEGGSDNDNGMTRSVTTTIPRILQGENIDDISDADGDTPFVEGVCYKQVPFDPDRHKQVYTVGVLAIRGFEDAYNEFNKSKKFVDRAHSLVLSLPFFPFHVVTASSIIPSIQYQAYSFIHSSFSLYIYISFFRSFVT